MTRLLKTPVFGTQNSLLSKTKFVDQSTSGKSFLAERLAAAGHLGGETARKIFLTSGKKEVLKNSVGGIDVNRIHFDSIEARAAARETFHKLEEEDRARTARVRAELQAVDDDGRIDFYDLIDGKVCNEFAGDVAALDAEEREDAPDALDRVQGLLPNAFLPFLERFSEGRRRERLQAILDKVGWKTLKLLDLDPPLLDAEADKAAWIYAKKHPEDDERYQKPEHRRGRTPKYWKAKLKKQVRQARPYIAMALGAVGGRNEFRPLYVSDFGVKCRRSELRHIRKTLEKLRIVNVNDPTVQIPMLEAHERKKIKEMAKRRMLLNIMQFRAEAIGAKAVWITITLPGRFHANPTNATPDTNDWDWRLGPKEAMAALQERYHQTMCMLRERGIRVWGFWDNQAQQDSTPHKHMVIFVHSEDEDKALREARDVATAFRNRFPGQHGCEASVIGDDHPNFKPRKDKRNEDETVASIIRYTARYSTKMATGVDGVELSGEIPDDDVPASEMERHAVWASERNARLHTVIGMDNQRAPSKIWDCVWKAAERGEAPADKRMELAVDWMRSTQDLLKEVVDKQTELDVLKKSGKNDLVGETILADDLKNLQIGLDENAYHTALLCGLWGDADMHSTEREWLCDVLDIKADEDLPIGPVPLRGERENAFGETIKETIGIAAPIIVDEETDDCLKIRMPDGTSRFVIPSDDETRQIILKAEKWEIMDADTAKELSDRAMQVRAEAKAKWDERQALEKDMRKALWESEKAKSAENDIEEGTESYDFIEVNKGLSDIGISPRICKNEIFDKPLAIENSPDDPPF